MIPRFDSFAALGAHGFSAMAYAEWGEREAARTVVCVHGLTRNGRDFDTLARSLAAKGYRVAAPDMPGRGASEWLPGPEFYTYPLYVGAMAALLARLGAREVDWVGTSMGGIIGMMIAARSGTPVRRLVLNDIGPFIPKAALERLAGYVGGDPRFDDIAGVEKYLRDVAAPFGPLSDAEWRHLAVHSAAPTPDGRLRLRYDPGIGDAFKTQPIADIDLWAVWEKVSCPVLVIRGAESDLLLKTTADEMTERGAAAAKGLVQVVEISGCGHAPALMATDQIARIVEFLATT
jgi:pimeloyl-ACP methyl ester carboxylesterase